MVAPHYPTKILCVVAFVLISNQVVDARVPQFCFHMALVSGSTTRSFPQHPGQACALADGKKWTTVVRRTLPADWLSLLNGATPRALLQYRALTVPNALVFAIPDANDATIPGVPQSSVLARSLEILKITDTNTARALAEASHKAEMQNEFLLR